MPTITKKNPKLKKRPPSDDIISGILPASQQEIGGTKAIFYGGTGTGRTTCACTWPKPLLVIRCEQVEDGVRVVRNVKGVDVTPALSSDNQLTEIIDHQVKTGKYKTIVLDSVTFFQDLVLQRVLGLKEVPIGFSWAMADRSTWGTVGVEVKERLRNLLQLAQDGTDIILTGGERSINDDSESGLLEPKMTCALTPAAVGWLGVVCNCMIAFCKMPRVITKTVTVGDKSVETQSQTGAVDYCARVGPDPLWITKVSRPDGRLVPLPAVIVDPDYGKLSKLIQGVK